MSVMRIFNFSVVMNFHSNGTGLHTFICVCGVNYALVLQLLSLLAGNPVHLPQFIMDSGYFLSKESYIVCH